MKYPRAQKHNSQIQVEIKTRVKNRGHFQEERIFQIIDGMIKKINNLSILVKLSANKKKQRLKKIKQNLDQNRK